MHLETDIKVPDAIRALAFIGDLSMGQPTDHSLRTAWLSGRIAQAAGQDAGACESVRQVAMLRWSGCTANAPEFADLIGDDVAGRAIMLARKFDDPAFTYVETRLHPVAQSLMKIHCEVSGDIAKLLGVGRDVECALRNIFEAYGGEASAGTPPNREIPGSVFVVALASDLEILSRAQGLERAKAIIALKSDSAYPRELVEIVIAHAGAWLAFLGADEAWQKDVIATPGLDAMLVPLELVADVIDLKLPWMAGNSRRVALAAAMGAQAIGLDDEAQQRCYRAALLHGVGRASVSNTVWNIVGPLPASAREQIRLAPYWTARAANQIGSLAGDAEIASYVGERLDGSGHFRGCKEAAIPMEARVVSVATAWVALQSPRPWRPAHSCEEATAILREDADAGRFDADIVRAICGMDDAGLPAMPMPAIDLQLTAREIDVFRGISRGQTNKQVARELGISPSTVRTHVEKVFRKLECTTRAAATLKALTLRL
ncbi:MAG TPA: HD domain-containing phosphohydrolase, partial [Herbaspirillum sp.]